MGSTLQISRNNSRALDHLSLQLFRFASVRSDRVCNQMIVAVVNEQV